MVRGSRRVNYSQQGKPASAVHADVELRLIDPGWRPLPDPALNLLGVEFAFKGALRKPESKRSETKLPIQLLLDSALPRVFELPRGRGK